MIAEILRNRLRNPYVLVVFPRNEDLGGLVTAMAAAGHVPLICHTLEGAQEVMRHQYIQAIICDDHLPPIELNAILKLAKHRRKPIPVIIASRNGEWEEFLEALRRAAFEYLTLPPDQGEVRRVLELALAESHEVSRQGSEFEQSRPFSAGEFVLGLGENRFEFAVQEEAFSLKPPTCSGSDA